MAKQPTVGKQLMGPWLSWVLLVLAYATYGGYLISLQATPLRWGLNIAFVLALAAAMTIGWWLCRRVILLSFGSSLVYILMALTLATFAMVAVWQFRMFAYLMLLVAASLLARVDMLIANFENTITFLGLSFLSLLGLGLAWIPHLLNASSQSPTG